MFKKIDNFDVKPIFSQNYPKNDEFCLKIPILATKLAPEGVTRPRREPIRKKKPTIFDQNPTAHFHLKRIVFGPNCSSHACARIKRLVITPRRV